MSQPIALDAPQAGAHSTSVLTPAEEHLVKRAIAVLEHRLFQRGPQLISPSATKSYLRLQLAQEDHEVFALIYLDTSHRVLGFERLFHGTIDHTKVQPRYVLQRALDHRAAALILIHNHPSGLTEPSEVDRALTRRLKSLFAEVDIRVLDHFIIGQGEPFSFLENGLL